MSKLNTDTNKKEFIKKFTVAWNTPTERWRIPADPGHVWNWTDQSLQQAYKKGREDERESLIEDLDLEVEAWMAVHEEQQRTFKTKDFIEHLRKTALDKK